MLRAAYWVIYLVLALVIAKTGFAAFSVPWTWTSKQSLVAFWALSALFAGGFWLVIWLREGTAGVQERWTRRRNKVSEKFFLWSLMIWVAIAVVLVILFDVFPHGV